MPFWSCETQGRSNAVFISVFKAILHLCIETPGICEKNWSWRSADHSKHPLPIVPDMSFDPLHPPWLLRGHKKTGRGWWLRRSFGASQGLPLHFRGQSMVGLPWRPSAPWITMCIPLVSIRKMVIHGWNWLDDLGIFGGNPHDLGNLHVIWLENLISLLKTSNTDLVGGLEHVLFFHLLAIIIPTD